MKKTNNTLQNRMNDFYFEALTPDGEKVVLSLEHQKENQPQRKPEGKTPL